MSTTKKIDLNIADILERICEVIGSRQNIDVARELGISGQAVSSWKARGNIPWKALFILAREKNVFFEWLITGEGEKNKSDEENLISNLKSKLDSQKKIILLFEEHVELLKETVESLKKKNRELQNFQDSIQIKHQDDQSAGIESQGKNSMEKSIALDKKAA